jgi:hypothetical protein
LVLDIGVSVLGLVLALFLPSLLAPRRLSEAAWLFASAVGGAIAVMLVTGLFAVGVGAAVCIVFFIFAFHRAPKLDAQWHRRLIGFAIVFAWWGGMLVATPFYTPYPRLVLPGLAAAWLAAALYWDDSVRLNEQQEAQRTGSLSGCIFFGIAFVCVPLGAALLLPHPDHLEQTGDRRGLIYIAQQIRRTDTTGQPRAIYVLGEPAILFQLRTAGEQLVVPLQEVPADPATADGRPIPTFLIAGPHTQRQPDFQRQIAAAQDRWILDREFDYQPSPIVWLDLNDPRRSPKETATLDRVRVYRLRD